MSSYAYGALTQRREQATPGKSLRGGSSPPGVSTYIDAMAAIVPVEVLAVHAAILPLATDTTTNTEGDAVTVITEPGVLIGIFFAMIVLCLVIFVGGRGFKPEWDGLDYVRLAVPPLAFVVWTMLQKASAFDALAPKMDEVPLAGRRP